MSLHAASQYILFRLKARGRHGTHSPFVYRFVDQVLRDEEGNRISFSTQELVLRLSSVYGMPMGSNPMLTATIVLLNSDEENDWVSVVSAYTSVLSNGFVVLPSIHQSTKQTNSWENAKSLTSVSMSIDLYHSGILLSRPEFKEKQHFVLR